MNVNGIDWDDLISSIEASEIFGVEKSYFRIAIRDGKIIENEDCKKIGGSWVYSKKALEHFFYNEGRKKKKRGY